MLYFSIDREDTYNMLQLFKKKNKRFMICYGKNKKKEKKLFGSV